MLFLAHREKASTAVVQKLLTGGYLDKINTAAVGGSIEGKIIKVDGTKRIVIYALRDIAKSEFDSKSTSPLRHTGC